VLARLLGDDAGPVVRVLYRDGLVREWPRSMLVVEHGHGAPEPRSRVTPRRPPGARPAASPAPTPPRRRRAAGLLRAALVPVLAAAAALFGGWTLLDRDDRAPCAINRASGEKLCGDQLATLCDRLARRHQEAARRDPDARPHTPATTRDSCASTGVSLP